MLEVEYDASPAQFVITSRRAGTVRKSYPGHVASYRAVSDTEFVVVNADGVEERYSDDGFRIA